MSGLIDLLTGPDARTALARRDIGAVYRVLIDAGVSQARIAQATGQRQSEISAVVNGRRVQSIALLERIADGLGVPRGWLGLSYSPGCEPKQVPDEEPNEQDRRENLLRHGATMLFGTPVFGVARPLSVREAPTPHRKRIGFGDIECLRSATDQLERLYGALGGIPTCPTLTAHARAGEVLLGADMDEAVRKRLLAVLGGLHSAAGCAAVDAGQRELAREHHARGMTCAGAADDMPGVSNNLRGAGQAELYFGAPAEALKLFQLGAATAPTALLRGVFEHRTALAFAMLGSVDEAHAALSRARHAFSTVGDDLSYHGGTVDLTLGHLDGAVAKLTAAVEVVAHAKRCSTANFAELATAQLRAGELRDGLRTAAVVIDNARTLRSVWVRARLAPLQRAAAARRDSACQDVARELATLRAA